MINPDEVFLLTKQIDPQSSLPPSMQALRIALYDEYRAYETYKSVVAVFGAVPPFINIVDAEQRHIMAVEGLCATYGVPLPFNNWIGKVKVAPTFSENCEIGVAAEIDNINMYDYLLGFVNEPDIKDVFFRLQAASFNNHLPAFRSCAASASQTPNMNFTDLKQDSNELFLGLQNALSQKIGQKELEGILSHLGGDFLIGALGGALLGAILGGENLFKGENL